MSLEALMFSSLGELSGTKRLTLAIAVAALSSLAIASILFALKLRAFSGIDLVAASPASLIEFGAVALCLGLAVAFFWRRRRIQSLLEHSRELQRSESWLRAAVDRSDDAILLLEKVTDTRGRIADFRILTANRHAEQMLGEDRSRFLGACLGERYPALQASGRIDQFKRVWDTGEPLDTEIQGTQLEDGQGTTICRLQATRFEQGVIVTCTDITSFKAANQELQRALAFNRAIVLSSPFSIIVTDTQGRITTANPAAERMLLYSEEELRGQSVLLLHDPQEIVKRAEDLSAELQTPVNPNFELLRIIANIGLDDDKEWTYIAKNGTRVPVQLTVSAVEDEDGQVIGLMGMSFDLTDRKEADEYIYHLAHHDTLTGLPGRSLVRDRLEVAIERAKRFQTLFSVLMIDLDHFKRVNDSLGHQAGDIVLCEVAERLKRLLRGVDTVGRFGGDEFIVIVSELQGRGHAEQVARKIIHALTTPIRVFGHDITVTASIGVSLYPDSLTPDELIRHADIAMYRSKALGRNNVVAFTPDLGKELIYRLSMESALRAALERNEFFLVYQPQVSLETSELTGVEALIRWRNPELGLVMPSDFIGLAEESGLIVQIGAWAMHTACAEIAHLERVLGHNLMVAVNVSPRQVHQHDFQLTIESALAHSGLDPSHLEVEITEHLLMRDSEESLEIIERIQELGVSTAIDDFGTGFSNMSYITRFKVDRIKIDRSFISRCADDENSLAVTTAIIALAHSLKMKVVAEGVETPAHASTLRSLRCDYAQGYLYSRPLNLEELRRFAESVDRKIHLKAV